MLKDILAKVPIFSGLTGDLLEKLAKIAVKESFNKGEILFKEGSPGDSLYIIVEGEAVAEKLIDKEKEESKVLGILKAGDIFGEMALFGKNPRSATIKARSELEVLKIAQQDFQNFLLQDIEDGAKILGKIIIILSDRLRQTDQELVTLYETGRIIGSSTGLKPMLDAILEQIMSSVTSAQSGVCGIWNIYNEEFDTLAAQGISPEELEKCVLTKQHPLIIRLQNILTESPDNMSAIMPKGEEISEPECLKVSSLLAAPLFSRDKFYGFILLLNREKENAFTSSQMNLLWGVASQVGGAVEIAAFREEEAARKRLEQVRW